MIHPACVKAAVSAPTPENTHQYSSACPGLWSLKTNLLLAAAFKLTFFSKIRIRPFSNRECDSAKQETDVHPGSTTVQRATA